MKEEKEKKFFNRLINHGPVLLLTTERKGRPNAMAISWHAPVSHDPPLLAVSVSPGNYSYRLIEASGELVLNVPTVKLAREVHFCGTIHGSEVDKFKETGLTPCAGGLVKAPHVSQCIGHLECAVKDEVETGDHTLFICSVRLVVVEADLFDEAWCIEDDDLLTLHHLGKNFYAPIGKRKEIDLSGGLH